MWEEWRRGEERLWKKMEIGGGERKEEEEVRGGGGGGGERKENLNDLRVSVRTTSKLFAQTIHIHIHANTFLNICNTHLHTHANKFTFSPIYTLIHTQKITQH